MANKKRRCRYCKDYKIVKDGFLTPNNAFFCSIEHATAHQYPKAVQEVQKAKNAKHRASLARIKPKTKRLNNLQTVVNEFIRLRDQDLDCISCGLPNDGSHQRHASHYKGRGHNSFLRFYTLNIHASCAQCNAFKSGNISGYTPRLEARYSPGLVQKLINSPTVRDFSDDWILRATRIFKRKIKMYKYKFRT